MHVIDEYINLFRDINNYVGGSYRSEMRVQMVFFVLLFYIWIFSAKSDLSGLAD